MIVTPIDNPSELLAALLLPQVVAVKFMSGTRGITVPVVDKRYVTGAIFEMAIKELARNQPLKFNMSAHLMDENHEIGTAHWTIKGVVKQIQPEKSPK